MYCDGMCTGWELFKYQAPFFLVVILLAVVIYRVVRRVVRRRREEAEYERSIGSR